MKIKKEYWIKGAIFLLCLLLYFGSHFYPGDNLPFIPSALVGIVSAIISAFIFEKIIFGLLFGYGFIPMSLLLLLCIKYNNDEYFKEGLLENILYNAIFFTVLFFIYKLSRFFIRERSKTEKALKKILFTLLFLITFIFASMISIALIAPQY